MPGHAAHAPPGASSPKACTCPTPVISAQDGLDPEQQALLAEGIGLALLVVLDTLTPAERLAFVLHDTFAVPFDEIAPIVGRSPAATRQLASRARRRIQRQVTVPDTDLARQREVVDAFFAAAHDGDFTALVAMLDPDVVVRADTGAVPVGPGGWSAVPWPRPSSCAPSVASRGLPGSRNQR
jgi:Sigma-70, region 4